MLKLALVLSVIIPLLDIGGGIVRACPDGEHGHTHAKRAFPQVPLQTPTRPLVWQDFNVIHTTDTHGWLLGHQHLSEPEPNYSGDFGDFASFVSHMKNIAEAKGVDLLLVDSGDVHDGTGLSDGFPPGGLDAHASNQFIKLLPYDLLTIGNHELSDGFPVAQDMLNDFAPFWKGRYLTSNVNITVFNATLNKNVSQPIGERFVKFLSPIKKRRITSLGVLFDFTGNAAGTTVQTVEDMVKEQWFAEAIADEPDLFLLVGHMPVSRDKWPVVFDAIRAVHKTTPILIFGGHSHIRDCLQMDGRSMSLESGRYMETIGWMSVNLDEGLNTFDPFAKTKNLTFSRRYLDQNRVTYQFHTQTNNFTFDTRDGQNVTKGLNNLAKSFDLAQFFGTAPQDFFLTRAPFPSNQSILSLFVDEAAPIALAINNSRANNSKVIFTNSGEMRFDILAGAFTKNDQFTALPFADAFLVIPNVTFGIAKGILDGLNGQNQDVKRALFEDRETQLYASGSVDHIYNAWLREMSRQYNAELARRALFEPQPKPVPKSVGYVTNDSCSGVGDDVPHVALPFFDTPDFIGTTPPNITDDSAPIDVVFINFIESSVLSTMNKLANGTMTFTSNNTMSYSSLLANQIFGVFAQVAWNS